MLPDAVVEEISEKFVENAAEALLARYEVFRGERVFPVPVESIAEHLLGYTIEITDQGLFGDVNVLGGISFEHATIFVNALVEHHEGRYSFTLAHEIGHHVLHRGAYEALVNDPPRILCRNDQKKSLVEKQADKFAAALLMPRSRIGMSDCIEKQHSALRSVPEAIEFALTLRDECGFTNVSLSALLNRLKDINVIHHDVPYQTGSRLGFRHRPSWRAIVLSNLRRLGLF